MQPSKMKAASVAWVAPVLGSVRAKVQDCFTEFADAGDNGAVTLPVKGPAGNGGVKGVIVVRLGAGTYLAFERNCPYRPYDACALVSLDRSSRLFMRDSCCNSQFDLRGQITGGPTPRPLKQYGTSLQGTLLNVTN